MSTDSTSPLESLVPDFRSDVLAERLAVGWRAVVFCAATSLLFLYFDNLPIYHTDIWGHVSYGDWILEHGRLPDEDPVLDLAEGVPLVDSAWLSQVIFARAYALGGGPWVSHLFGLLMTGSVVLFTLGLWIRTESPTFGLLSAFGILALAPTRIAVVRPETFGLFLAAALFLAMTLAERRLRDAADRLVWPFGLVIAIVLLAWANLHGSYVVGLAIIGARVLGRTLEVWGRALIESRRDGSTSPIRTAFAAVVRDRAFQFWLVTAELAVAATCVNPYGVDLLINAMLFPANPNLADVLEWKPLPLISIEGIVFAASWVLLVVAARYSRMSFRVHEVIALALLNLAVIKGVRMINWYAVVYAFAVAPHVRDVALRALTWYCENWRVNDAHAPTRGATTSEESESLVERLRGRSLVHTAVCGLLLWWGFAFSPMGNTLLGGEPRSDDRLYHRWTPHEAGEYLAEHPSRGRVFNPQWWGDWLVREAPDQRYFMTTNAVHLAPRRVWLDYLRVARGGQGWEEVLDRYEVSTVVIQEEVQRQLVERIRKDTDWRLVHDDGLALVFERNVHEVTP